MASAHLNFDEHLQRLHLQPRRDGNEADVRWVELNEPILQANELHVCELSDRSAGHSGRRTTSLCGTGGGRVLCRSSSLHADWHAHLRCDPSAEPLNDGDERGGRSGHHARLKGVGAARQSVIVQAHRIFCRHNRDAGR